MQKNQLLKCKPLQANRPLEPLDMREPCPIFFTRGESGLEPHSPRVKIIYNIIYQLSKCKKNQFPKCKKLSSQVQKISFPVQKISFPILNLNFPSAKNQLPKCKKISFPRANLNFPSAKNQLPKCKKIASHVQTLTSQVQKISFPSANLTSQVQKISFPSAKN